MAVWFLIYWESFHQVGLTTAVCSSVYSWFMARSFEFRAEVREICKGGGRFGSKFFRHGVRLVDTFLYQKPSPSFLEILILGTGMGVANAVVFEPVPSSVLNTAGEASGWIDGLGGTGTLLILPVLDVFTDVYGAIGYAETLLCSLS